MNKLEVFRILPEIIGKVYYIEILTKLELDNESMKFVPSYEIMLERFSSRKDADIWLFNNRHYLKTQGFTL